jgi:peptidoglycan/LPS O-acetylase OafA/YrhL
MMVLPVAAALAVRIVPLAADASLTTLWIAFIPWYLALTAASAYVLHRYVEKPVLVWRDRRLRSTADPGGDRGEDQLVRSDVLPRLRLRVRDLFT